MNALIAYVLKTFGPVIIKYIIDYVLEQIKQAEALDPELKKKLSGRLRSAEDGPFRNI
jgi:hypothetical protein